MSDYLGIGFHFDLEDVRLERLVLFNVLARVLLEQPVIINYTYPLILANAWQVGYYINTMLRQSRRRTHARDHEELR